MVLLVLNNKKKKKEWETVFSILVSGQGTQVILNWLILAIFGWWGCQLKDDRCLLFHENVNNRLRMRDTNLEHAFELVLSNRSEVIIINSCRSDN